MSMRFDRFDERYLPDKVRLVPIKKVDVTCTRLEDFKLPFPEASVVVEVNSPPLPAPPAVASKLSSLLEKEPPRRIRL